VISRDAIVAEIPRLRRFARAISGDAALADDLVQDCLERALSRLHLFRRPDNLRAWLFTILRNIHLNSIRGQKRRDALALQQHAADSQRTQQPTQLDDAHLRDLARALDELSLEQKEVILLVGLEELSYRETAAVLDVPVGTVMSRLSRGRERLRALIEERDQPILRSVT